MQKNKIMTFLKYSFSICIIVFILNSCKKNQVGGSGSVQGIVAHHEKPIGEAYVYIKYNTAEFPGDDYNVYDTYVKADASGHYSIPFYKGAYYIYARGYDYALPAPYIVKGGLSVNVRNNEKLTKDIAVVE